MSNMDPTATTLAKVSIFVYILKCTVMNKERELTIHILLWAGNFSLNHRVQTGSGAQPVSYPTGNRSFFPAVKVASS